MNNNKKQEKIVNTFKKVKNIISISKRINSLMEWSDIILGKGTLLLLWILELFGVCWIIVTNYRFTETINIVRNANTAFDLEKANTLLNAVRISSECLNGLVIAMCAILPATIGAIKSVNSIYKRKNDKLPPTT